MRKLKLREGTNTAALFGHHDRHLKLIEDDLGVRLSARGEEVTLDGLPDATRQAERILFELANLTNEGLVLQADDVTHALTALRQTPDVSIKEVLVNATSIVTKKRFVGPKSPTQKAYIEAIEQHDIVIAIGPAAHLFKPGDHGSTFGGNPIAAAAGIAVIAEIKRTKLQSNALKMSKLLTRQLSKISGVSEVRGKGLLIGIGLTNPVANEISNKLLEKGVLVNSPNPNTIRIAPALILNSREVKRFVKIFNEVMNG